jgi:hypothetical protein
MVEQASRESILLSDRKTKVVCDRGGDRGKSEDQPHAKQIAHAPQPAMRRADAERQPVPVASDAEWALPDARRSVAGRAEG